MKEYEFCYFFTIKQLNCFSDILVKIYLIYYKNERTHEIYYFFLHLFQKKYLILHPLKGMLYYY